jgi:DNA-binding MarR family transcriptional regulator
MSDVPRLATKMAEQCPGVRLRKAQRVVAKIYDDALRPVGLQISQLPVLVALVFFGEAGATMNALSRALVMDRTTVTRSIRPLEKAGYVRVARSAEDARARVILLTRAGERALEEALPLWERGYKEIRAALGPATLAALGDRLDEVIALRGAG